MCRPRNSTSGGASDDRSASFRSRAAHSCGRGLRGDRRPVGRGLVTGPASAVTPDRAQTTVAFLDVSAGVAGDMCLGALVDAGLPIATLEEVVAALGLEGVRVRARTVKKGALVATKIDVLLPGVPEAAPEAHAGHTHAHDHPHVHGADHPPAHPQEHRRLADVLKIIRAAKGLPAEALADAVRTFTLLAQAEGRVHGISPEEVHFHEVGAADALVDIVGTCVGLARLGVREVRASALPWFTGRAHMAHGELPLPAPAVALLMTGHPTYPSGETFEQVTPTGAALVKALSRGHLPPAGFVPRRTGVGAGDHPGGKLPNVVRLILGDVGASSSPSDAVLLETNLDDATGQEIGHAIEKALASGALDAWAVPCVMKKGRPGVVLSVLAEPATASVLEDLIFRETPTLGVRRRAVERRVLPRRLVQVTTRYGPVHVKVRETPGGEEGTPEYEDCRQAASRAGISWREVASEAFAVWKATSRSERSGAG